MASTNQLITLLFIVFLTGVLSANNPGELQPKLIKLCSGKVITWEEYMEYRNALTKLQEDRGVSESAEVILKKFVAKDPFEEEILETFVNTPGRGVYSQQAHTRGVSCSLLKGT